MKVSEAKIIDIPKIEDRRGNLSVVEEYKQIPFKIAEHIGFMMCLVVKAEAVMHTRSLNSCL